MRSAHVVLFALAVAATACGAAPDTTTEDTSVGHLGTDSAIPERPSADGSVAPWGGSNASRWRPEAIIANAASSALNAAWKRPGVADAVVAIPTKMIASSFFEFGDGQADAAPSFPWWTESRPQVVATLSRSTSGGRKSSFVSTMRFRTGERRSRRSTRRTAVGPSPR